MAVREPAGKDRSCMTRKDYVRLATALGQARKEANYSHATFHGVNIAIDYIGEALKADNARFDMHRFFEAVAKAEDN